jgi:hypothetical protein
MRFVLYSLTQRVLFHALRLIGAIDIREMIVGIDHHQRGLRKPSQLLLFPR